MEYVTNMWFECNFKLLHLLSEGRKNLVVPRSKTVAVGDTVIFYCKGERVMWKYHKEALLNNVRTGYDSKKSRHFLKITHARLTNSRDYQCFSEIYDFQAFEDTATLVVTCKF